jgi:transcriptional regulator with XRE-family HTH domain
MITVTQIRAARALLAWKQSDLAAASGISLPAIARLEKDVGNPRSGTINAIQTAFETQGVRFIGTTGVDLEREIFKIEIFEGKTGIQHVWDDVVEALKDKPGSEFLMSSMNEKDWFDTFGDKVNIEMQRRFKLGVKSRLMIKEGDNLCLGTSEEYRCVPAAIFGQTPYFVYADRYAIINWDPMRIILIRSQSVADTFRSQFEFNWSLGKPVTNPRILYPLFG